MQTHWYLVGWALPGDGGGHEQYFLTLMRYIEMNPVRADMAAHPRDYPWSSYEFNALGETGKNAGWLTQHLEYKCLSEIVPGGGFKRGFDGDSGWHAQGLGLGE